MYMSFSNSYFIRQLKLSKFIIIIIIIALIGGDLIGRVEYLIYFCLVQRKLTFFHSHDFLTLTLLGLCGYINGSWPRCSIEEVEFVNFFNRH